MLKQTLTLGLVAAMSAAPAWSQISVYIGIAPPPIRIETPPPPPEPSFVWVNGFWAPEGSQYRWVPGHYRRPPYEGASWIVPRYEHGPQGWHYREGYWGRPEHGRGHAYGHDKAWKDDDDRDHGHGHGEGEHGHGRHRDD